MRIGRQELGGTFSYSEFNRRVMDGDLSTAYTTPLGMSHFPDEQSDKDEERHNTGVSLFTRAQSIIVSIYKRNLAGAQQDLQSAMQPVPLMKTSLSAYEDRLQGQ